MIRHGRKHGDQNSYAFPVWNGIFDHAEQIGGAIWVFLWCIDKVTQDRDGIGIVLGGAPVKISRIAADLKMGEHTIRRHSDLLEKESYIQRTRTPYGFVIEVRKSLKFGIWGARESVQRRKVSRPNLADLTVKNGRNKEDHAVNHAVDAAAAASKFWSQVGIDPAELPGAFRKTCEELLHTKNGQPLSEFMGECMDAWKISGGKTYPPAFAKAKARIAQEEKERAGKLPELEAIPWQKK